jgi:hypothetical protein
MKYIYTIYEHETDKYYKLEIHEIINHIKNNPENTYYKILYDLKNKEQEKILINKDIVLNTEFIAHRINTKAELEEIDTQFGVELDLRDDHKTGKLILSHDPFLEGEYFEDYLEKYKHNTMILNIKSERIELECLKLIEKYNNNSKNNNNKERCELKYFFLDSSFPMIYLLDKEYNNQNIAFRFSEYEPINQFLEISDKVKYIWVDCFTKFPLTPEIYKTIKSNKKSSKESDKYDIKICLVSPELQKQLQKIDEYREYIIKNRIIPDMICCKIYNIINWI